jgi:hypothetical protein
MSLRLAYAAVLRAVGWLALTAPTSHAAGGGDDDDSRTPADTQMMGIVHAAFRGDLARVRLVLTAVLAPPGGPPENAQQA